MGEQLINKSIDEKELRDLIPFLLIPVSAVLFLIGAVVEPHMANLRDSGLLNERDAWFFNNIYSHANAVSYVFIAPVVYVLIKALIEGSEEDEKSRFIKNIETHLSGIVIVAVLILILIEQGADLPIINSFGVESMADLPAAIWGLMTSKWAIDYMENREN